MLPLKSRVLQFVERVRVGVDVGVVVVHVLNDGGLLDSDGGADQAYVQCGELAAGQSDINFEEISHLWSPCGEEVKEVARVVR